MKLGLRLLVGEKHVSILKLGLYELSSEGFIIDFFQRQAFYDSCEEMLTKLDEFGGLVDMV